MIWTPTAACRGCGSAALAEVLSFGATPLADRLVPGDAEDDPNGDGDPAAPLALLFCDACALAQLSAAVEPALLFGGAYRYQPSASSTLARHFADSALALIAQLRLGAGSTVIEAACNDGLMLRHFQAAGCRVLGIDPAPGPVAAAAARGLPVKAAFFDRALAETLSAEGWRADLFVANNVLAHVPDPLGFLAGVGRLLAPEGVLVAEVGYVGDLIAQSAFDMIYHQHLCYFSATALQAILARCGLVLTRIECIPPQGGSLRFHARRGGVPETSVGSLLAAERMAGLDRRSAFDGFGARVGTVCADLRRLLDRLQARRIRVAGYGAAAKATTLMAAAGITRRDIAFIVDRNPEKHGTCMPGVRIPIVSPHYLDADPPDALLVFAWNLYAEIRAELAAFSAGGGRYIVPIPTPRIERCGTGA